MSRRERQRRKRRNRGGPHRMIFLSIGVVVAVAVIGALSVLGYVVGVAASAPNLADLRPISPGATSVVYAADGERLGFIYGDTLRTEITSRQMPQIIRDATVAVEDKRFYKHQGVDFEGVVRAAIKNLTSHKTVQGGSTLTMQLIRNIYTADTSKSFQRKIREAKLAEEMENDHPGIAGKEWILTSYLNDVPYGTVNGKNAIGIEAASRLYFDKPASKLNLPQAALLAGLPQAPSQYNPFDHREAARTRRNEVLRNMAEQGYITSQQAAKAIRAPLGTHSNGYYTSRREKYFFDYVKSELVKKYGADEIQRGGLQVYTTIDLKLQKLARDSIARSLAAPGDPSAALVSIDPANGHIVAMASSASYGQSSFNLAAQSHRQPGSTFKVMVLMAALKQGVPPSTTYLSAPLDFTDADTHTPIKVTTDDHVYHGRSSIFDGLVRSDNTVYQQLDLDVGPQEVKQTAYDMGITSHLDGYPAEGLGGLTHGVSPLEMTRAYTTINTGGERIKPVAIRKVIRADGSVDTSVARQNRKRVFTDGQAYEAIKAMEANVQRGTGTRAGLSGCPTAGKTGTTSDFVDAWFDGFTTNLNTAVWVGYPKGSVPMRAVPGWGEMFGGTAPAAIWHDFMQVAASGIGAGCKPFPQPKQPFESQPFFGHYATNGPPGGAIDPLNRTPPPNPGTTGSDKSKKDGSGSKGGKGDGKGGKGFDPQKYESPPQSSPNTQAPGSGGGTTAPPG